LNSIASAPAKVILFGEHFVVYGVKAILCSIDKRVKVTTTSIDEKKIIIKSSLVSGEIDLKNPQNEIKKSFKPFAFMAKKMIEEYNHEKGLEILIDSDIPSGVGLGSSSACCVAAAASISGLFTKYSKEDVLELALNAERIIFKDASGADSTVCTYGGIIEYDKEGGFNKLDVNLDFHIIIANSMQTHSTNKIVTKVRDYRRKNPKMFTSLCKKETDLIKHVFEDLKNNDLASLGKSMSQNQEYLELIGISNKKINSMIKTVNDICFGAKITGAGGGGCIIALAEESKIDKTIKSLRIKNIECFSAKIDSKGLDTF